MDTWKNLLKEKKKKEKEGKKEERYVTSSLFKKLKMWKVHEMNVWLVA